MEEVRSDAGPERMAMAAVVTRGAIRVAVAVIAFFEPELRHHIPSLLADLFRRRPTSTCTINIPETIPSTGGPNDLYDAAQIYLGARCLAAAPHVVLEKPRGHAAPLASLAVAYTARDTFNGINLLWSSKGDHSPPEGATAHYRDGDDYNSASRRSSPRLLELRFHRRHRDAVHGEYIPAVLRAAEEIRFTARERRMYTNKSGMHHPWEEGSRMWYSQPFNHPSTFDTIAMDPELKDSIKADLLGFVASRGDYERAGRAWKCGYLLHGPPGTGKSSLVAAMSNLLEFDIYFVDLTDVSSNSHLRRLLTSTTPKSIIVVEDIDCALPDVTGSRNNNADGAGDNPRRRWGRESMVTLAGILNALDGLPSAAMSERVVVFTTNHPELLDPALLRPGRMDRRIELGYCRAPALKVLAKNYLGGDGEAHGMLPLAGELLAQVDLSPAEVAEVFLRCKREAAAVAGTGGGADAAMEMLVAELRSRLAAANTTQNE